MVTAALVAGGGTLFSSMMQGQASAAQAAAQKQQFEWSEFTRRMDTQIKNRQIAKQNAIRWQQNKDIASAANKTRAEEEFWLRYNYDNETSAFSRQTKQANDQLVGTLSGRNINLKSQTAKQLLRQSLETNKEFLVNRRVAFGTSMLTAKRKQENALSTRNFGYNAHITFMPGVDTSPDPKSIMKNALISGLVGGAAAGYGAYSAESFRQDQMNFMRDQMPNSYGFMGGGSPSLGNVGAMGGVGSIAQSIQAGKSSILMG